MVPPERWPTTLADAVSRCRLFNEVRVLAETASTQDAARELASHSGLVVTAWRQTGGRGRLGRGWVDTGEDGVAVTFIAPDASPERLAVASAVAVARTTAWLARSNTTVRVGIKWPNDVVVARRKIAGILIERTREVALIGVGLNAGQHSFEGELAKTATSLRLLGIEVDRCAVLERLILDLDAALAEDAESLASAYAERDALRGTHAVFGTPEGEVAGVVVRVSPFEGIVIVCDGVERCLASATTTVSSWKDCSSR